MPSDSRKRAVGVVGRFSFVENPRSREEMVAPAGDKDASLSRVLWRVVGRGVLADLPEEGGVTALIVVRALPMEAVLSREVILYDLERFCGL